MRIKIEQEELLGQISNRHIVEVDDGNNVYQDIDILLKAARTAFDSIFTAHDAQTKNFPLLRGDNGFLQEEQNGFEK